MLHGNWERREVGPASVCQTPREASECKVSSLGCRRLEVLDFEFGVQGWGLRVEGPEFGVEGLKWGPEG